MITDFPKMRLSYACSSKENLLFCLYVDISMCLTLNKNKAKKLMKELEQFFYILADKQPLSANCSLLQNLSSSLWGESNFNSSNCLNSGLKDVCMHDTADMILHQDQNRRNRKNEFYL